MSGADRFPPSRRPTWTALAVAVVLIGALTSVLGARVLAQRDAAQTDQAVSASSESIAATLQLALQHEQDLAISSGSFVAGAPGASATAYRQVGMPSRTSKDSKCVKPRPLTVPPANSLDDKSDSCPRYCTRSSIFATIVVRSTGGFKLATRNP